VLQRNILWQELRLAISYRQIGLPYLGLSNKPLMLCYKALRAAIVDCFVAICFAKSGACRMFLTKDLDAVFFGVVNLMYSGSAEDVRICGRKICGVWPGDAWSSNPLSSASRASSKTYTGPVRCDNVTSRIACPWPSVSWGGSC
jgi:hypothetical protein